VQPVQRLLPEALRLHHRHAYHPSMCSSETNLDYIVTKQKKTPHTTQATTN
jgi:hypothetical protein